MWSVWRNVLSCFCRQSLALSRRIFTARSVSLLCIVTVFLLCAVFVGSSFILNAAPLPDEECEADMVHIALTDDISHVSVVWASVNYCDWDVVYGLLDGKLSSKAMPDTANLTIHNNYGTRFWYRALLTGLMPDSKYNYLIKSRKMTDNGEVFRFQTMQADHLWHTRLMFYGDLSLASTILKDVVEEGVKNYDAVFHVGDIGYTLDREDGLVGDTFLWSMEPLAGRVPYMVVPGDQEMSARFKHFQIRFSVPGVPWPIPFDRTWYSLDIGMIHVVAINTEVYNSGRDDIVDAQLTWLKQDLQSANANRSHVPWIVVLGHRPFYTISRVEPPTRDFTTMETLFYRNHVDLVIQSHAHMYERTWPVYRGRSDRAYSARKAPVYVTVGTPGYRYGSERLAGRLPVWSAAAYPDSKAESFGRLTVLGSHKLLWQQISPSIPDYPLDEFALE